MIYGGGAFYAQTFTHSARAAKHTEISNTENAFIIGSKKKRSQEREMEL